MRSRYLLFITIVLLFQTSMILANPPEMLISHSRINGELTVDPYKSYLCPKVQMPLLQYPIPGSTVVANLNAGESAKIVHYEMHSYPNKGKTLILEQIPSWGRVSAQEANLTKILPSPGEYIYILFYIGEGEYLAWYNDSIITIPGEGISNLPLNGTMGVKTVWAEYQGLPQRGEEIWFCLRKNSGQEGWVRFKSRNDWNVMYKGVGIFLPNPM